MCFLCTFNHSVGSIVIIITPVSPFFLSFLFFFSIFFHCFLFFHHFSLLFPILLFPPSSNCHVPKNSSWLSQPFATNSLQSARACNPALELAFQKALFIDHLFDFLATQRAYKISILPLIRLILVYPYCTTNAPNMHQ